MNSSRVNVDDLEPYSRALVTAVLRVFAQWLEWRVDHIIRASGRDMNDHMVSRIGEEVQRAHSELSISLTTLLRTDVDAQAKGPLQVIREAASLMNSVLQEFGVPAASRDEYDARFLPLDVYGIGPLAWRDLGDDVHDAGVEWGAWKAATVLQRRRNEGKLDQ